MKMPKSFYIEGSKTLIFRREGDKYITFDPEKLEFSRLNIIGAELLYLVSLNLNYNNIKKHFISKNNISDDTISKDIELFFNNFSCTNLISNKLQSLEINI